MRHILIISFTGLLLGSCGKWIVGDNPANTPSINYDYFYTAVKEHYSFFTEKEVTWDSLDQIYRPIVHPDMGNDSLYTIMSTMLRHLKDGHVNMYVNNDRSRYADWYLDHPANFNKGFLVRQYWGKDYHSTGPFLNTWMDSIGYVYYGAFTRSFSKGQLDFVLNRFSNAKGLIIDVRENGGGSMGNVSKLVGRFIEDRTFFATFDRKNGPGANDFSTPDSVFITPRVSYKDEKKKEKPEDEKTEEEADHNDSQVGKWTVSDSTAMMLNKPIIVLINRYSYSATNFFAGYMSTLPNVTLIGDRSGGGGGIPVSFELPNGWKFRLSATRTFLPDGTNIELGITPDIYQSTGPKDELLGTDAIIERAKQYILSQSSLEN